MRRFSGIYVLYVKFDSQKNAKIAVRVLEAWSSNLHTSTKKKKRALAVLFFFFTGVGDENYILAKQEGVRIFLTKIDKLACQAK